VAQDSGGEDAAGPHYDAAAATFVTLIDRHHVVTGLYGMVNVPSGVWIDEAGKIIRPPEVAYSKQYDFRVLKAGDDRYAEGLLHWLEEGEESPFVLDPDIVRARLAPASQGRAQADVHFKLAVELQTLGRAEEADEHWREAQRLDPENWNYHRQQWSFDPDTAGRKWQEKYQDLGDKPYYESADLPVD
jgi:tetratricopeptide (TPR) repeat protein